MKAVSLYLTGGGTGEGEASVFLEAVRQAEALGLSAVWLAEGDGLFLNPAVLAAAAATTVRRIALRAGGLALPLHNPIRVAEEWALVDNLSGGRAGIAFSSGATGETAGVETVLRLWRGEAVRVPDGEGRPIDVRLCPRPVQPELPLWSTDPAAAAALGAGLFVPDGSQAQLEAYRAAGGRGAVTVALGARELESLEGMEGVEWALRTDLAGALEALGALENLRGR